MGRRIERLYPWLISAAASAAWVWFKLPFPVDEKEFLAAAISVGAILTGFVATAKAILAALPSDSLMGRLRSSGYIDDLIVYLAESLYGCLFFSVYGMAGFFLLGRDQSTLNHSWFAAGWVFLATFSLLAFDRVARLLLQVIRSSA